MEVDFCPVLCIAEIYYGVDKKFYKGNKQVTCDRRNARALPCQQYKKMLLNKGIVFQNETALFAYQLLKKYPEVAAAIAERFPIIIIDEVQDTSVNQMAVFDLLSDSGIKSMFLVGDPDQSIYEWRNANPECFIQKLEDSRWKTIELTGNLTRGRIYLDTDISDLWKSKEIELYAKAAYEWKCGARKNAYKEAEKASFSMIFNEDVDDYVMRQKIREYPDKERELWRTFDSTPYELRIAMGNLGEDEMVSLLDYSKYYDKLEMPIPRNRDKVLEDLQHEKFIKKNDAGTWDITNMGALMIAKDLKKFESLHRRTVRVIWYKENSRLDAIREKEFCAGYAFSHEEIAQYIMTIIPQEEVIVEATRKSVVSFPEIAIRELLANAMIHQDLQQRGTNPMVEVFKNRIEFSNAGAPLVAIERIVDSVPVSRNENIAGFMHKCGICEERGSGYDKVVEATGKNELLAPRIENQNNQFTKAILFAKVPFELTTKEDRMRTCYMQACLAYVNFEGISNSDIRKIFGLGEKEKAKASRLLTSAVEGGYIKVMDPDTAPRYKKYVPYWA